MLLIILLKYLRFFTGRNIEILCKNLFQDSLETYILANAFMLCEY